MPKYNHVDLWKQPISVSNFKRRILPLYILKCGWILLKNINSPYFSLYTSLFLHFIYKAIPFEQLYSNFDVKAVLSKDLYSPSHIAETVVCHAHGGKYYMIQLSDMSIDRDRHFPAFLGCDGYFVWGEKHIIGNEGG